MHDELDGVWKALSDTTRRSNHDGRFGAGRSSMIRERRRSVMPSHWSSAMSADYMKPMPRIFRRNLNQPGLTAITWIG